MELDQRFLEEWVECVCGDATFLEGSAKTVNVEVASEAQKVMVEEELRGRGLRSSLGSNLTVGILAS